MPYGRLTYIRKGADFSPPTWDFVPHITDALLEIIKEVVFDDTKAGRKDRKDMLDRLRLFQPKKPKQSYVIRRAIKHMQQWLRDNDMIIDLVTSEDEKDKGQTFYRIFKRVESGGDVDHEQDQFIAFENDSGDLVQSRTNITAETAVELDAAIEHVNTYCIWEDVRTLALRSFNAAGIVDLKVFHLVLPHLYDKFDQFVELFEMYGVDVFVLHIDSEDESKVNDMLVDRFIEQVTEFTEEINEKVGDMKQKKSVEKRLEHLDEMREKIGLYTSILGAAQGQLADMLDSAEVHIAEKLESMTKGD